MDFRDKLMFVPGNLSGAPLKPLALPTNIRLGWKGLPGTNTLAYSENPQIMAVKSFMVQAPGYPTEE